MQIVTIEGGLRVPTDSHIGEWQQQTQKLCHDEFLPYCAAEFIKLGDTVIDIGAFDGDHTILYSEKVGVEGKVLAIEPGKTAFECLDHNIKLFQFKNTVAANYGVSDVPGLSSHIVSDNLGASHLSGNGGDVILCPLPLLFKMYDLKKIDFIKLDCEGWELKALTGARDLVLEFKPVIMMEVNDQTLKRQGTCEEELFDYLAQLGYSFFCVNGELRSNEPQYDVICQAV